MKLNVRRACPQRRKLLKSARLLAVAIVIALVLSTPLLPTRAAQATGPVGSGDSTKPRPPAPASSTSALSTIFDEAVLADNVLAVHERTNALPDAERFSFLLEHVLPRESQGLKLTGKFVPLELAGNSTEDEPTPSGGILISPLFNLLDIATQTGRLQELVDRTEMFLPASEHQRRAKSAMLILLALQRKDFTTATSEFDQFIEMVHDHSPESIYAQWPEMLVAWRAVKRFPKWGPVSDLLEHLRDSRGKKNVPRNSDGLHTHIWALAAINQLKKMSPDWKEEAPAFSQWVSATRARSETLGLGFPAASWRWNNNVGTHVTGHESDLLYYASPLTGDFDVNADIDARGRMQVLGAGLYLSNSWQPNEVTFGNIRMGGGPQKLQPPFAKIERWLHYRAAYRNETCRVYLNGRLVKTLERSAAAPWVAMRCWSSSDGSFRDVRITGTPRVPSSIPLLNQELNGWSDFYDKPHIAALYAWDSDVDEDGGTQLVGGHRPQLAGTGAERLFRYIRPIPETGTIEYEFFYAPGKMIMYPAIDRMAFVLNPASKKSAPITIHRITNGAYEQSEYRSRPDEVPQEVINGNLPLQPNAWNQMLVRLDGDVVELKLNGQSVCRHQLDDGNARLPGVFYFGGESELRVRKMMMTGHWPATVPQLAEQELADQTALQLNQTRPTEVFEHDFASAGLDERYIDVSPGKSSIISAVDGVGAFLTVNSTGAWTQSGINPTFRMHGDFDTFVRLQSLQTTGETSNGGGIVIWMANGHQIELFRRHQKDNRQRVTVGWKEPAGDGEFRNSWKHISTEATQGTLRIARRGDEIFTLFAENDSDQFRLVDSRIIPDCAKQRAALRLQAIANKGGNTVAAFASIRLEADELWHVPDPREAIPTTLFVMNIDGSELRQLTQPIPDRNTQGSPEWTPDGKRIAFDTWTGQADSSDMHIINVDGTGLQSLGLGSMPSFSPSGDKLCCTSLLRGTIVMDSAGKNRESLTDEGWGFQWSPNGKWIAYESTHRENGRSQRNITLLDVETGQKQQILKGADAHRYSWIYYNMEWSPDSQQICFKGVVPGGREIAILNVADSSVKVISTIDLTPDFAWHPDGKTILVSGLLSQLGGGDPEATYSQKGHRLYVYDITKETFELLPGQPMNQTNTNMALSPNGQQIVFSSKPFPGPVRWTSSAKQ